MMIGRGTAVNYQQRKNRIVIVSKYRFWSNVIFPHVSFRSEIRMVIIQVQHISLKIKISCFSSCNATLPPDPMENINKCYTLYNTENFDLDYLDDD